MDGKYLTSFDGARIYYHLTPRDKNKWIIFLHGLGGDLTAWKNERRYFDERGISTVALDLRGHGLSARGQDKSFYKLENFSKDLVALIEAEKIKNAVVIGHCFGGMVSIHFGAKFPKYSKALVLIDTSYRSPFFGKNFVEQALLQDLLGIMIRYVPDLRVGGHADFNKFIGTPDIDGKRLLSDILHTSLHSYLLICENLIGYDSKELLKMIVAPSLIIDGTKDSVFPPKMAEYLKDRIKRSELDLIEGANHIVVLNNPKDLSKSIESFLKKIHFIN